MKCPTDAPVVRFRTSSRAIGVHGGVALSGFQPSAISKLCIPLPDYALDGGVTELLIHARESGEDISSQLYSLVYEELYRLARHQMRGQNAGHTLQATALVNEAFLRLVRAPDRRWENRKHFLGFAARAMRSVLVDHARGKNARKRLPDGDRLPLDIVIERVADTGLDLVELDEALIALAKLDPQLARLVELRFFAGMSMNELAQLFGWNLRKVERAWTTARTFLRRQLHES